MRGRIEAGAAIAALFLALGAISLNQGWSTAISIVFFAFAGLAILGAFANRLPWLHRLPGIGDPRLSATLSVDGRSNLTVRVPRGEARHALIHVGIKNASRLDVQPAHVNFLMTERIKRYKCNHNGVPSTEGFWMRPTLERIGSDDQSPYKDYWAISRSFAGDASTVWWFKVRFRRPDSYRFLLKINSASLYEEFVQRFEVTVEELTGEPGPVERLDGVIDQGEEVLEGADDGRGHLLGKYTAFITAAESAIPEQFRGLYEDADGDWHDAPTGSDYFVSQVQAKIAVLCEIRRRLGEESQDVTEEADVNSIEVALPAPP
ncbi:MAG TPA: hypothetical protein VNY83_00640 [Solirubrobacterales bacterium]|jgi:hypothetical protein|nr:hypothetical protein [Solirubrobacterales bacterium]